MTGRPASFEKLTKILKLEAEFGYRDRAVIGGLAQYAPKWQDEARRESGDAQRIEAITERLRSYGSTGDIEARRQSVEHMLSLLSRATAGMADAPGAPSAPSPATTTAGETREDERHGDAVSTGARWPAMPAAPAGPGAAPQPADRVAPEGPSRNGMGMPFSREYRRPARGERATLDSPATSIPGIGPSIAEKLGRLGVKTIRDLLFCLPRRYDDFTALRPINRLQYGEEVTIIGSVWEVGMRRTRGGAQIVQATISDGSGTIQCTWFNPYLIDKIRRGQQIVVSGKVTEYLGRLTFQSPEWELLEKDLLHTARLVPIYPLTEGLTGRGMRKLMRRAVDEWAGRVPDSLPDSVLASTGLFSLSRAIQQAHFPDSTMQRDAARRRLAFDELFMLQMGLLRQRRRWKSQNGRAIDVSPATLDQFLGALPYALTAAQRRALDDVLSDMRSGQPMNRLIQGDVGSGKTIVAAAAMFAVAQAGAQAAIMAPTEILAEQHYQNFTRVFANLDAGGLAQPFDSAPRSLRSGTSQGRPVSIRLLTGSTPHAEREALLAGVASGQTHILIGTHALIQQGVEFRDLAFVVIDEQHRFGVQQRAALRQKGVKPDEGPASPHVLVMTATPIPRTLALTLYGDLDLSVIDEMPPGRQPIVTRVVLPTERERMYSFVRSQIEKGRQAYIICPLVEESENIEAKAAVEEHERLQKHIFPQFKLGLLHGRMKSEEKDAVMRAFAANELNILVSTSVVEVGIDVPNATVMLIEGANRFGLSQLHQFRGRVGRGTEKSYCLLLADSTANGMNERLQAVEATQDGFALAEKDLELRGPGEFLGTRQSGLPDMRLANMADARLIDLARREAEKLISADPTLEAPEHGALAQRLHAFWSSGAGDLS
ncbi:MAG TPA: ATP-dependent DNA helicase RecG [Anaerolineae bacterium]|nr:ATP-dependent DNA helicase RecG [Anaerolineae bacterium]